MKNLQLEHLFAILIVGGAVAIGAIFLVLLAITSPTGQRANHGGTEYQGQTASNAPTNDEHITATGSIKIDRHQTPPSDYLQQNTEQIHGYDSSPRESVFAPKFSDFILLYLTFCLAVVGYFQILRGEKNIKDLERAFITCGPVVSAAHPQMPQFPVPNIIVENNQAKVMMSAQNSGRTPAILKEFFVQFSLNEPLGDVAMYGQGETHLMDMGHPPTVNCLIRITPFMSPHTTTQFCFGYIRYQDIFKKTHTNRFCMKITPGSNESSMAGSPAYNEWD